MRSRVDVYDHMLRLQADMAYPYERSLYQTQSWKRSTTVLDFGCGNAHYLAKLRGAYPDKVYLGVEHDPDMAARAQARYGDDLRILAGDVDCLPTNYSFDCLLLRLVCLHLPNRRILQELVKRHGTPTAHVIVIDADDEFFMFDPEPPRFLTALRRLREEQAVNRELRQVVAKEWTDAGFVQSFEHRFIINSDYPGNRERMFLYMYMTAELALGAPLDRNIAEELLEWVLDGVSYVQYGVFGSVFERKASA